MNNIDIRNLKPDEIQRLEPDILIDMLDQFPVLKKIIALVEERAKELLEGDPNALRGVYYLHPGALVQKIGDVETAVSRILSVKDADGLNPMVLPNELLRLAQFKVTDLRSLVKEKVGCTIDEAKEQLADILGDSLVEHQNAPSLRRADQ